MSNQPQLVQEAANIPAQMIKRVPKVGGSTPKSVTPGVAASKVSKPKLPNIKQLIGKSPTVPAGTQPLPTVNVSGDQITLFGQNVSRKHLYIAMALFLLCVLAYIWWKGNKDDKDGTRTNKATEITNATKTTCIRQR